jgi:hypothetical protein
MPTGLSVGDGVLVAEATFRDGRATSADLDDPERTGCGGDRFADAADRAADDL